MSNLPERRRIWPLALILFAACAAIIGYARWTESVSQPRLESILRQAVADELNDALPSSGYTVDDIKLRDIKRSPTRSPDIFLAQGLVTFPRKPFQSEYLRGGKSPVFSPTGEVKLIFRIYCSKAPERIAIARQLGPIRPTLRISQFHTYRKPEDSSGMPIDVNQPVGALWPRMEEATYSDLFDVRVILATCYAWQIQLWPDSLVALDARTIRAQGDPGGAADLLIGNLLATDAYKAPLVRGEVEKVKQALKPGDPRIAGLERLMHEPSRVPVTTGADVRAVSTSRRLSASRRRR